MFNLLGSIANQVGFSLKIKVLSVVLKAIYGIRMGLLFLVAIIVSAMMAILSVFTGFLYLIYQNMQNNVFSFDAVLIFCSSVFVVSIFIFLILMSKKSWFKILKIDTVLKEILETKNFGSKKI